MADSENQKQTRLPAGQYVPHAYDNFSRLFSRNWFVLLELRGPRSVNDELV